MFVDLHVHTTASDGTFQPQEAVACAKAQNLSAIAITDHDTIDGIKPAQEAGKQLGIEVIEGVELGCDLAGREIHILGYLIRRNSQVLLAALSNLAEERTARAQEMVRRLNKLGIGVLWEDVAALAGDGTVGRLHIARVLTSGGWARDQSDAFARYLDRDKPAYVPRQRLSPAGAIELIHQAGGVAVLAHPKLIGRDQVIRELAAEGLDGIEVYHVCHDWQDVAKYKQLARKFGLLLTGGSDCHGPAGKGEVLLGKILTPIECLIQLQERAREYRC